MRQSPAVRQINWENQKQAEKRKRERIERELMEEGYREPDVSDIYDDETGDDLI